MKLIIEGFNKSIHKKGKQIIIKEKEEIIDSITIEKLTDITIIGKGHISFDALNLISKYNIKLMSFDYFGHLNYVLESPNQTNVYLKKQQYKLSETYNGFELAKQFILSKLLNQKATLNTLNKNKKFPLVKEMEKLIKEDIIELNNLTFIEDDLNKNKMRIMGIEGKASLKYWKAIKHILPSDLNFEKRTKKPTDIVNSMLNYGYAILASEITKNILLSGLDPYCGFLHFDMNKRTSLTFDLIEEFRQQLVDKVIFSLVNTKQISSKDLDLRNNSLKLEKRKIIASKVLDKMYSEITYNDSTLTYCDIIKNQVNNLVSFISEGKNYQGFSLRW